MCFASGLPDAERFSQYYGQSSKYDLSADDAKVSSFDVQRHQGSAAFIAEHVSDRAGPVLDIGTATGDFLVALRDLGFTNVHGVEPSPEAARKARESYGLDVIAEIRVRRGSDGRLASRSLPWSPSSSIWSTLRQPCVRSPTLLRTDGLLYLLVPDAARFADLIDAPYQEFSVEHINYFTAASLRNLLGANGYDVEANRATTLTVSGDAEGPALEVLCRLVDRPPTQDSIDTASMTSATTSPAASRTKTRC